MGIERELRATLQRCNAATIFGVRDMRYLCGGDSEDMGRGVSPVLLQCDSSVTPVN